MGPIVSEARPGLSAGHDSWAGAAVLPLKSEHRLGPGMRAIGSLILQRPVTNEYQQ